MFNHWRFDRVKRKIKCIFNFAFERAFHSAAPDPCVLWVFICVSVMLGSRYLSAPKIISRHSNRSDRSTKKDFFYEMRAQIQYTHNSITKCLTWIRSTTSLYLVFMCICFWAFYAFCLLFSFVAPHACIHFVYLLHFTTIILQIFTIFTVFVPILYRR